MTVSYTGGIPGAHASWAVVTGAFSITSPNAFSTTFSETLSSGASDAGVARCTVTSPDGQTDHIDVNVSLAVAVPQPPVWNVDFGMNLGTWQAGGPFHFVDLYAVSPTSPNVVYNVGSDFTWGSGNSGPEPWFPYNSTVANGAGGQFGGQVSAGTPPGDYAATFFALNPADGSSSLIQVVVTVA